MEQSISRQNETFVQEPRHSAEVEYAKLLLIGGRSISETRKNTFDIRIISFLFLVSEIIHKFILKNSSHTKHRSDVFLIQLLEADILCIFSKTLSAHVQAVFANKTVSV